MTNNNLCRLLLMVIVFMAIALGIIKTFNISLGESPESKTRVDLHCMNAAFGILLRDNNQSLSNLIATMPDINASKKVLRDILTDTGMKSIWDRIEDGDAWGNEYNFAWFKNCDSTCIAASRNNNPLLIWSSGKNGVNECGKGDDIADDNDWGL